ncbi:MAG: permease-like cell division protein FtsX [Candidatus Eutrophobiaceae bacterium]
MSLIGAWLAILRKLKSRFDFGAGQMEKLPAATVSPMRPSKQGAFSSLDIMRRSQQWFLRHVQAIGMSLRQHSRTPWGSLFTHLVISIALALPAGFFLSLENLRQISDDLGKDAQVSVFLKPEIDMPKAERVLAELRQEAGVEGIQLLDKEQALQDYRVYSGFSSAIDSLEENPLPHMLIVTLEGDVADLARHAALIEFIHSLPEVDIAQHDQEWVNRLSGYMEVVQRVVILFSILLGLAVGLVISNTIRLSINLRREEIQISKLFGASDSFIHRPFLYSGLWYGLGGAMFAWLLLKLSVWFLHSPVQDLVDAYQSDFVMIAPGWGYFLAMLGIAAALGVMGSGISVRQHIRGFESM